MKNTLKNSDALETIPPITVGDEIITDMQHKAHLFNEFFISICNIDDTLGSLPLDPPIFDHVNTLNQIIVTERDVADQIQLLDCNKSYGPDGISPRFLKEGGTGVIKSLTRLFNMSLSHGKCPQSWKMANVIPIHKKDSRSDINNYRPISLLSTGGKMLERIVFRHVFNFFKDNYIISAYQSGFLPGRSTVTQLIEVYHHFCSAVDSNKEIRVIFLDISKAFDKVWHKGLLYKLKRCGISGSLLLWFHDYLHGRQQRVVISGHTSPWGSIKAGVPQGSVLGPLLFLIYINDITHVVHNCSIRLFADDTCLFIEVDNTIECAERINADLEQIHNW